MAQKVSDTTIKSWRQQSLAQLGHFDLGDPDKAPTNLVRRCTILVKVPVGKLTAGDLRILIGQQIGLPYLVPLAIEKLQRNILLDAELYEGDLLESLLRLNISFWHKHANWWKTIDALITPERTALEEQGISTTLFDAYNVGQ